MKWKSKSLPLKTGEDKEGGVTKQLVPLAKDLRKNSTEVEKLLWYHLRRERMGGMKFRRQEPIGKYIVDFVCFSKKLIIELDGGQHAEDESKKKDDVRDAWLRSRGFTVIRFWNNEILSNLYGVLEEIMRCLSSSPSP